MRNQYCAGSLSRWIGWSVSYRATTASCWRLSWVASGELALENRSTTSPKDTAEEISMLVPPGLSAGGSQRPPTLETAAARDQPTLVHRIDPFGSVGLGGMPSPQSRDLEQSLAH